MSPGNPKNPRLPPIPLAIEPSEVTTCQSTLWRIHTTTGAHSASWNDLRRYGPLSQFRWEPHPPPPRVHSTAAVSYAALDYVTTFAEVFQRDRAISLTPGRALSAWQPTRPLALLDLTTSDWALRHRASASLPQAPKNTCRAWAHAIWDQLGDDIDGLRAPSTVVNAQPVIVLFGRAASALPAGPAFSRALNHRDVASLAVRAGHRLGWPVR